MRISDWSSDVCSSDLPTTGSGYMLGSVEQLDNFLTKHLIPDFDAIEGAHDSPEHKQAQIDQWKVFINYCETMLNAMPRGGMTIESGGQYKRAQNWLIKSVDDDGSRVTKSIVTIYDQDRTSTRLKYS